MSVSLRLQIFKEDEQVDSDEDIKKRLNELHKDALIELVMDCKRSIHTYQRIREEENMPW